MLGQTLRHGCPAGIVRVGRNGGGVGGACAHVERETGYILLPFLANGLEDTIDILALV